ncbi:DUF559 domain-containing protein [Micromonospora sp. MMS20-R1-14]|uniref:DUF559 domain-containing protein n=1 Tax=Micromonospora humida TaxID=2809018 RepID=A0ABS2J3Z7_9ACTN|nr:DUF559 domain-containing protein [Micromonospora humida]
MGGLGEADGWGRGRAAGRGRRPRGVGGVVGERGVRWQALLHRLPEGVVVGFQSGAHLHGFGAVPSDDLHVIVPAGGRVPQVRGVVVHQAVLAVPEPVLVAGLPCAPADRCAVDLARTVARLDALPLLDLCLRVGACRPEGLTAEVARHARLRGVDQARQLVRLADPRSECRQESQLRLVLIDGGLPAPEPQIWVSDDEGFRRYRLDLGYRRSRVGIEYDGLSHLDRDRLHHDRARMNWLAAHGWRMRHFTAHDLYRHPSVITTQIAHLLHP